MPAPDLVRLGGNPLALGPLADRADLQRAVGDLCAPLVARTSAGGARVRLGSPGAAFDQAAADLEGFARPLYGIVPLVVGGGRFDGWERIVRGLDAGTDPASDEYWGPVGTDVDQRMVEQAAIGLALAFCPEHTWEALHPAAQQRLVRWLWGVFEHEPAPNNWQFFRILVALGLERVGAPVDAEKVAASHRLIERYRRGPHWYVDGDLGTVDHYVAFALHTYGLFCAAAADIGLGDAARAEQFRERAAGFAPDFRHWWAPDGTVLPLGRSLTYRFAMSSFWGALAWADVASEVPWGEARGHTVRNLRWWAGQPICEAAGLLSVGFTYANRTLAESYNSPGSPYWAMKAFAGLAAPADHPYWTEREAAAPLPPGPVTIGDPGWVVARDEHQTQVLVAQEAWPIEFPEQAGAKYRKFAYSTRFGLCADVADLFGGHVTDSTLALTDAEGNRRVRLGVDAAGVVDGMAWSTWRPWPDVRVDTVCWAIDAATHGRIHQITTDRPLGTVETGFAVACPPGRIVGSGAAELTTDDGTTVLVDLPVGGPVRAGSVRAVAVNACLLHPHAAVPVLTAALEPGTHRLAAVVHARPPEAPAKLDSHDVPQAVVDRLDELSI